jgi:metallophosphoesterase superfamily enzyme
MPAIFIHLSDIHFGQEKGGQLVINNDVKARLIEDAAKVVAGLPGGRAAGVLVTGDIAYSGKKDEYRSAADFLDTLAERVGCKKTDVQLVPGNHDIDRGEISHAVGWMLAEITAEGEPQLDAFLASPNDREALYRRFWAYRPFAEGYDCPLDGEGGLAGNQAVSLAPDRTLRFIGLNSALACGKEDEEGALLLGARQRVLPWAAGEELVVLTHHPLNWLRDSDDARRYVRNRARVLISGHEHNPAVRVEEVKVGCDLMMLAAGATAPPDVDDVFTYVYNVIEFDWEADADALKVTIHPRAWSDEDKDSDDDPVRLGGHKPAFVLGCPNFRQGGKPTQQPAPDMPAAIPVDAAPTPTSSGPQEMEPMAERFALLLLRFFRDLSEGQRLAVLVRLGALPDDWPDPLTHTMERKIVDGLAAQKRLDELESAITYVETETGPGEGPA